MLIAGERREASSGRSFELTNPATGEVIARVPLGDADDLRAAVEAATVAAPDWGETLARDRGKVLARAATLIRARTDRLAEQLTREQGKPLREAVDEVRGAANVFEYYAGLASSFADTRIRLGGGLEAEVRREPIGVTGAIIPWNLPALLFAWKAVPAILCGNAQIVKPASTAPLTPLALAECLHEAGLPPGVLNVVTGPGETVGEVLVTDPAVRKISFTGSSATGKRVMALAADRVARVTLELGGSDPMIVCADANLDSAVAGAVSGRYYNCGQVCTAVKRLFIQETIADEFMRRLTASVNRLRVGNGLEAGTTMGPLNTMAARDRISGLVDRVRERDEGTVAVGGTVPGAPGSTAGAYYAPTVVTDVAPESALMTEEVFGPVLPVVRFANLDEALRLANDSRFGLGASIWTRNPETIREAPGRLQAGIVWVNLHLKVPPEVPFGGVKESGLGRENGAQALDAWSEEKTVLVRL
ncbi:MAG: aldehyde dehydrogenase family protein [Methanospirillum sp.]